MRTTQINFLTAILHNEDDSETISYPQIKNPTTPNTIKRRPRKTPKKIKRKRKTKNNRKKIKKTRPTKLWEPKNEDLSMSI